ncbi:AAA family ATPase [Candidatus Gracilibacteria bacterium]|nr:AAA family ATPase [Candidatus Gracilibacteria bacterium]
MYNLINKNLRYLKEYPIFNNNNDFIQKIIKKLNKDKIVVITGMRGLHKTSILKEFIEKTSSTNYLYINDELDAENTIKNDSDFFELLKLYEKKYDFCNIIVLQNVTKIQNIKNVISELYKLKKYKIIIIGNNIHIDSSKELEICNTVIGQYINYSVNDWKNILNYGTLQEIKLLNNDYFKKLFLDNIKNKIVLQDIITNYSIKTVILLYHSITKLAFLNTSMSIREFHKLILTQNISIALQTLIDYIDFSVNSRLIKRCLTYDLKNNKPIITRIRYYFADIGIRNTFAGEKVSDTILVENMIYNDLISKYKEVYNGVSGKSDFCFYIKDNNSIIHISNETDINEIKKDINKLNKIESNGEKTLILSHLDMIDFNIDIDGVKVIGLNNI